MPGGARRGTNKTFSLFTSDIVAIGTEIILDGIDTSKPHCFVGAQFFADDQGAAQAIPTAGSVAIKIQTLNSAPIFEDPPNTTIDPAAPVTLSWAANTTKVKATPTGIDIAAYWRLIVTCNET